MQASAQWQRQAHPLGDWRGQTTSANFNSAEDASRDAPSQHNGSRSSPSTLNQAEPRHLENGRSASLHSLSQQYRSASPGALGAADAEQRDLWNSKAQDAAHSPGEHFQQWAQVKQEPSQSQQQQSHEQLAGNLYARSQQLGMGPLDSPLESMPSFTPTHGYTQSPSSERMHDGKSYFGYSAGISSRRDSDARQSQSSYGQEQSSSWASSQARGDASQQGRYDGQQISETHSFQSYQQQRSPPQQQQQQHFSPALPSSVEGTNSRGYAGTTTPHGFSQHRPDGTFPHMDLHGSRESLISRPSSRGWGSEGPNSFAQIAQMHQQQSASTVDPARFSQNLYGAHTIVGLPVTASTSSGVPFQPQNHHVSLGSQRALSGAAAAAAGQEFSIFVGDLSPDLREEDLVTQFLHPPAWPPSHPFAIAYAHAQQAIGNYSTPPRVGPAPFTSTKSAKIMTDPSTGASRGFGFVRFHQEIDCTRALVEMQGVVITPANGLSPGRPLRVCTATPKNRAPGSTTPSAPISQSVARASFPEQIQLHDSTTSLFGSGRSVQPHHGLTSSSFNSPFAPGGAFDVAGFGRAGTSQAPPPPRAASPFQPSGLASSLHMLSTSVGGSGSLDRSASLPSRLAHSPGSLQVSTPSISSVSPTFASAPFASAAPTVRSSISSVSTNGVPLSASSDVDQLDPNNTTIFVGGLSSLISEETLKTFFVPFGEITYVKIPPGKGCGFVQFVRKIDAERAIERMQGFPIGGGRIRLSWGRSSVHKAIFASTALQSSQLGQLANLAGLAGLSSLSAQQLAQLADLTSALNAAQQMSRSPTTSDLLSSSPTTDLIRQLAAAAANLPTTAASSANGFASSSTLEADRRASVPFASSSAGSNFGGYSYRSGFDLHKPAQQQADVQVQDARHHLGPLFASLDGESEANSPRGQAAAPAASDPTSDLTALLARLEMQNRNSAQPTRSQSAIVGSHLQEAQWQRSDTQAHTFPRQMGKTDKPSNWGHLSNLSGFSPFSPAASPQAQSDLPLPSEDQQSDNNANSAASASTPRSSEFNKQ